MSWYNIVEMLAGVLMVALLVIQTCYYRGKKMTNESFICSVAIYSIVAVALFLGGLKPAMSAVFDVQNLMQEQVNVVDDRVTDANDEIKYWKNKVSELGTEVAVLRDAIEAINTGEQRFEHYGVGPSEWDPEGPLDNIIYNESRGDIHADNGRYKGLGQLHPDYYEKYVGKTWDECRDSVDLQIAAMQLYIGERYGTSDDAWEFWQKNGWY